MSNRVSSFAFLQTMNNSGPSEPDTPGATPRVATPAAAGFDREASAKFVLQELASHKGLANRGDLSQAAGLTDSETDVVFDYLGDAGLVVPSEGAVKLSDFGRDALSVFTLV